MLQARVSSFLLAHMLLTHVMRSSLEPYSLISRAEGIYFLCRVRLPQVSHYSNYEQTDMENWYHW